MPEALDLSRLATQHERIRRLARALVRSDQEADDIVQDAWVRAIERGPREPAALGAWLATVVRRLAGNARRGRRNRRARERDVARPEALPSSADIAARVDVESRLLAALESLDEPHRTVLRDRYLGGLDAPQIAARDGLTADAVRSRLKRARAALRGRLEEDGLGGDVHWTTAIGPLVLGPAGGALLVPVVDGAVGSGAAPVAVPTAANTTMLLGGALAMKKLAAAAVVATVGVVAWRVTASESEVQPTVPSIARSQGEAPEADLAAPTDTVETAGLEAPTASSSNTARASGIEAPAFGDPWRVTGKFRKAGGGGLADVDFTLAMYAGLAIDGDPLERFDMRTDAEGKFALDMERPARSVCFDVEVEDHPTRRYVVYEPYRGVRDREAPDIDVLVFVLDAKVEGTVFDVEGRPVAGAHVEGMSGEGTTRADGTFSIDVAARSYGQIQAWADGHGLAEAYVEELEVGSVANVELHLPREVVIRGVVRDARGGPIPNAEVHASHEEHWTDRTDAGGRYELRSVNHAAGEVLRVTATSDVHMSVQHEIRMSEGVFEHEQDFELTRGIRVTGVVHGPDGAPVAGAEVWTGWAAMAWDRVVTHSNDDGTFELDGAALGATRIGTTADGFPPVDREVELTNGQSVVLTLEAPRSVRGVVRDEEGAPVGGVAVAAKRDGDYLEGRARTADDGTFEISGFPSDGALGVEVYGSGWVRQRVPIPAMAFDGDEFVITIQAAGVLSGHVTDAATGAPITAFTVRIGWPSWPDGKPSGARTIQGIGSSWHDPGKTFESAEGRWSTDEHDELSPGDWAMVEVSAPGYATLRVSATQIAPIGDEAPLELALEPPVDAEVTVTIGGEPVAGARVIASSIEKPRQADPTWSATTGAAGVAVVQGVAPGPLFLRVEREGRVPSLHGPFEVSKGSTSFAIDLPAGRSVDVTVLNAAGDALAGERVMLASSDLRTAHEQCTILTTGADGRVRFEEVAPGRWRFGRAVGTDRYPKLDVPTDLQVTPGVEPLSVRLQPQGRATLDVSFEGTNTPPDGTSLQIIGEGVPNRAIVVEDGAASCDGVAAGRYRFEGWFWDRGIGESMKLSGEFDVADGDERVDATCTVERR